MENPLLRNRRHSKRRFLLIASTLLSIKLQAMPMLYTTLLDSLLGLQLSIH
jgi:hypothetical protein